MGTDESSDLLSRIAQRLNESGWEASDLIRDARGVLDGRVFEADLLILHDGYPVGVVELKADAAPAPPDDLLLARQEAFGAATTLTVNAKTPDTPRQVARNHPAKVWNHWPSPQELWEACGREWSATDPRLAPVKSEAGAHFGPHQVRAIGRVLDEISRGKKHLAIEMASGTGALSVATTCVAKIVASGLARSALIVSPSRSHLEQARVRLQALGIEAGWAVDSEPRETAVSLVTVARLRGSFAERRSFDLVVMLDATAMGATVGVLRHRWPEATFVALSPASSTPDSEVVFRYSVQDAIAAETTVPAGFRAVRLADVAEIAAGVSLGRGRSAERSTNRVVVRGRDIAEDGRVTTVNGEPMAVDAKVADRYTLRQGDILVPAISGPGLKVGRVADNTDAIFASSLIRIRVDATRAHPSQVYDFLRSQQGVLGLRRLSSSFSGGLRISTEALRNLTALVPEGASAPVDDDALSIGASMLRRLHSEVIPTLERWKELPHSPQSLPEAQEVAGVLRTMAAALEPASLPDLVIAEYPSPLSIAQRRFADAKFNVYEQVLRLRDLFEAAATFTFLVTAADLYRRLDNKAFRPAFAAAQNACRRNSTHARMQFVAKVNSIAAATPEILFVPELAGESVTGLVLDLQKSFRNRISHTAVARAKQQEQLLREFEPVVMDLLDSVSVLRGYRLARVLSYQFRDGACTRRSEVHRGVVPVLDESRVEAGFAGAYPVDQTHLVLINPDDEVLDLYPFYQVVEDAHSHYEPHIAFLKECDETSRRLRCETIAAVEVDLEGYDELVTLESQYAEPRSKT